MIDIIGVVQKDGQVYEGYHVNSLTMIDGADDHLVYPESPTRVFAGNDDFYCYRFKDEKQFRSFVPVIDEPVE